MKLHVDRSASAAKRREPTSTTIARAERDQRLFDRLVEAGVRVEIADVEAMTPAQQEQARRYAEARLLCLEGPPPFLPQPNLEIPDADDTSPASGPRIKPPEAMIPASYAGLWARLARLLGDTATDSAVAYEEVWEAALSQMIKRGIVGDDLRDLEDLLDPAREHARRFNAQLRVLVKDLEAERAP